MFLRRIGNKHGIANQIYKHFLPHTCYLENFFGAGGLFFNKPLAKYNILNDINSDVFNCFNVTIQNGDKLIDLIETAPYSQELFNKFRDEPAPQDPFLKALRFLFLSNYSYLGGGETLKFGSESHKKRLILKIKEFLKSDYIEHSQFTNCDFRKFIQKICFSKKKKYFLYSDPPYFGTENNYNEDLSWMKWKEQDVVDLFESNIASGLKFAISEFDHPFILETAKKYNLNIINICERQNLKNRANEILITNYETNNTLF